MYINGCDLDTSTLAALARSTEPNIELDPAQMEKAGRSRAMLESAVAEGKIIYGVNTSMGGFVKWLIPVEKANKLQTNLISSVASNVGSYFDDEVVRAAMITRCN